MCPSPPTSRYHFVLYFTDRNQGSGEAAQGPEEQVSSDSRTLSLCRFRVEMVQLGKQEDQDVPQDCHPGPSCMARLVSLHLSLPALQGPESACVVG